MKKIYQKVLILSIAFLVLVGAYFFLGSIRDKGPKPGEYPEPEKIVDVIYADMDEITIKTSEETFVLHSVMKKQKMVDESGTEYDAKVWELSSPTDMKGDEDSLNSIAISLSTVVVDKVIEENPTDLAQYGLDKPVSVTVKMKDGTQYGFDVGNPIPTGGSYYVMKHGSSKVYTMGAYTAEKVIINRLSIKDKVIATFLAEDITGFALEKKGEPVFSAVREKGEFNWKLTSPIQEDANSDVFDPMIDSVIRLTATEHIEENVADLSKYGLDQPTYTLEVKSPDKTFTIQMGKEKDRGITIYAKLPDNNDVFVISLDKFTYLDKPFKEIMEVFAYLTDIKNVSSIDIAMDGKVDTLKIEYDTSEDHDNDKDKFYLNGVEANQKDEKGKQYARRLYQSLVGVVSNAVELDATPPNVPAEITFTYHLKKDPGTVKVEFIPKDNVDYYVLRNGKFTGMTVDKSQFDRPVDTSITDYGGPRVALQVLKDVIAGKTEE